MENFRMLKQYEADLPFNVTSYLMGTDTRTIARASIDWIVKNKKKYICKSAQAENLFSKLEATSSEAESEYYALQLAAFHMGFVNNPYVFENGFFKEKSETKIYSKDIICYFVLYEDLFIPIGVVKDFVSEPVFCEIVSAFLRERLECFKSVVGDEIRICGECYEIIEDSGVRKNNMGKLKTFIWGFTILLAISFILKWLVFGLDWKSCETVMSGTDNFFQAIGFLAEKNYGINHNCWLNYVCFFVSLFWLVFVIFSVSPFSSSMIKGKKVAAASRCYSRTRYIEKKLLTYITEGEEQIKLLNEIQPSEFSQIKTQQKKNSRIFRYAEYVETVACEIDEYSSENAEYAKRKNAGLVFALLFFVLALGTVKLGMVSTDDDFLEKVNSQVIRIQNICDDKSTYAQKEYYGNSNVLVYAKPQVESLVLYELSAGQGYYIQEESENEMISVRFLTEYGYLSGWIENTPSTEYCAEDDDEIKRIAPSGALGNRQDFGEAENVYDEKSYTSWGVDGDEGGVGDYIELHLSEITPVDVLAIQTGNRYFGINSRPVAYTVEFLSDDALVASVDIRLEDSSKNQSFKLNKSVSADRVRFVIKDFVEGSAFNNLFISELSLYQRK